MKDADHDGVRDREDRASFPPTRCQTPIQSRYRCPFRTDRPMGELGSTRSQDLMPFACFAGALFSRPLIIAWGNPRPRRETWCRTKTGHVNPDLCDDHFRTTLIHARDGIQELYRACEC